MARITYIGDAQGVETFGLSFPKGLAVEVVDQKAIDKLGKNTAFIVENDVEDIKSKKVRKNG